ncbi:alpha/beta fold hydrolase [Roseibium aggregatum]|uniref:Alpha/beta hydrolase n=1 Tax=Roseibium aggregatum TaxID=187304 RepID=A0A926NYC5_9HYPH|nr:alpha/beta hydrolase [Roseibium aggregatum]MBD1548644.1 alpha/beta hydrolase [Roseibium aggregatum]
MPEFEWRDGVATTITVNGKSLEAVCYGPSPDQAPTIVLLHEGLGCVALWREFPKKLVEATGFGVFAWSRGGYGQSDTVDLPRPLDYMTREAVHVLPGVLDTIGFKHGILVGHSDGASIAAIYAGSVEDHRVRGLVLMAPHFFTEEGGLKSIAEAKEAYETGDLRFRLAKYHKDVDNAFRGWNDAWLDPGFKSWNIAEAIDYLRIPVLAIQGADDQYGTLAQIEEIENRIYSPVDVEILADCKHSPFLEQPEKTLAAISEFCARLERIETAEVEIA